MYICNTTGLYLNTSILILGNGVCSRFSEIDASVVFTFNGMNAGSKSGLNIDVRMTRNAFGQHRVTLSAGATKMSFLSMVENVLEKSLEQQTMALGCLPSTGFALVHGLWSYAENVSIDGMLFNPSLGRSKNLSPRKPLPQAFHNWLGERRISFERWLIGPCQAWSWSLIDEVGDEHQLDGSYFSTLSEVLQVFSAAANIGTLGELKDLAEVKIQPTIDLLRPSAMIFELEQKFYLSRLQSDTPNWWLYDTEASIVVECIAENLRKAQCQAFRQQIERSM